MESCFLPFPSFRPCGCGSGDSGCAVCGCCRTCADEVEADNDQDPFSLMQEQHSGLFCFHEGANLGGNIFGRACGRLQDQLQRRLDERRHRPRHRHSRYAPMPFRKGKLPLTSQPLQAYSHLNDPVLCGCLILGVCEIFLFGQIYGLMDCLLFSVKRVKL
ncbi:E3 ubiquitin-protein ligase MYCBP2 [Portunus trituberculatus]|uniref:E3 ubiquitin-protein ligase MYCBP2 n=1 Tax=Portunus trituberculatus TaxID=210409 RepID=A0A5B7KII0_PORTR|nr:E3 ubiquitin-protein ligase MYCBP2 [Portunus trituberculatus]